MPDVVIENPVLNSPFEEPSQHFVFAREGITNQVADGRRESAFFIPIAPVKRRGPQVAFDTEWTLDRMQPNALINRIRAQVGIWRQGGYVGITPTTRRLLEHWRDPGRERRLFFCQVEAAETAIFIAEVATRYGVPWIENTLRQENERYNGGLPRIAFKIATGGGKTVVMAMLIAWQTLNKAANRQDDRFADRFLVVTPGITVRDRLRVLKPGSPDNYYLAMDLVPADLIDTLNLATIEITNRHTFQRREKVDAAKLTKDLLKHGHDGDAFLETPQEMVNRACRAFGGRRSGIIVINDEGHHCYRKASEAAVEQLTADEKREAEEAAKAAEMWIKGLEAVKAKLGVKIIYDLSATPFFLRGSGYREGTLFPWVVSDFALIDAIEAGIVKVPRVPVADDRGVGELPTYRNLWVHIKDALPKGTRAAADAGGEPQLPGHLEAALHTLYENYVKSFQEWEQAGSDRPPVFIVVCNNTRVSKRVFDYLAGWEKPLLDGATVLVPGRLPLFSNVQDGRWRSSPNALLVDSVALNSGDGMTPEFKKAAATELEEFKAEYRLRTGRDAADLTDEDLLREVLNTVGKPGKLGGGIRCVVSVAMLAEGWDAATVTHILGVRAFGTQLLCEQVVGRALRRFSYVPDDEGKFAPEYAEVYGVPFSFLPTAGSTPRPKVPLLPNRVRALPERAELEIRYPRVVGYRYDIPAERLHAEFTPDCCLTLTTREVVTKVEVDPIVGRSDVHTLEDLRGVRLQAVAYGLARLVLEQHFRDEDGHPKVWLFPQLVELCRRWLRECLHCSSETYPQLVLLAEHSIRAAARIHQGIVQASGVAALIKPLLAPNGAIGSTAGVEFDTIKPVVETTKSHLDAVAIDSDWEAKLAQTLEAMPEVRAYVKNDRLGPDRKGLRIPYVNDGKPVEYVPDFIAELDDGGADPLHLLIEVTGERRAAKLAKAGTATSLWAPAINNWGQLGRWGYIEIHDPWMAADAIRAHLGRGGIIHA